MFTLIYLVTEYPSCDVIRAVIFATPLVLFTLNVLLALPELSVMSDKGLMEPYFGLSTVNWTGAFFTAPDVEFNAYTVMVAVSTPFATTQSVLVLMVETSGMCAELTPASNNKLMIIKIPAFTLILTTVIEVIINKSI